MYSSHVISSLTCFSTPHMPSSGSLYICYHNAVSGLLDDTTDHLIACWWQQRRLSDDGNCCVPKHVGELMTCEENI